MGKGFILYIVMSILFMRQAGAQQTIDVHCHNILPGYMAVLEKHDAAMEETFPLPAWDVESHIAFMRKAGIEYSVLTPLRNRGSEIRRRADGLFGSTTSIVPD